MRHGSMLVRALIVFGLGFVGFGRVAHAGEPFDDRIGIRTARLFLLMRADVQTDLGLASAQVIEINRAASALYRKAMRLKGKTGAGIVAARRVIDEDEARWLMAHLSPDQLLRLDQIDLQWEGASALLPASRPLVAEDLNLSREQQDAVARLIAEAVAQRPQLSWTYDQHTNLSRKAIAVLSDKQKTVWIQVLGRPCRFSIDGKAGAAAHETPRVGAVSAPRPRS